MTTCAFFAGLGVGKTLVLLAVVLLVFGNRLPGLGRSLGSSISEFKKGLSGYDDHRIP